MYLETQPRINNMIYSMTGFASSSHELAVGHFHLEVRTVNHRFLEIQFRIPEEFRILESKFREIISRKIQRGKVDFRLNFTPIPDATKPLQLNQPLVLQLLQLGQQVETLLPNARSLGIMDILRYPHVILNQELDLEQFSQNLFSWIESLLDDLNQSRAREGEKLKNFLETRIEKMQGLAEEVHPYLQQIIALFQEKLRTRLRDALIEANEERIRLEVALYLQKIDVEEELSRLKTHLSENLRVLSKGGLVGKRLDFLMQELNREANTLGSKSVCAEVSQIAMELKVLIEQMREQIQNIE